MPIPPPCNPDAPVALLISDLAEELGTASFVSICVDLLDGADRESCLPALRYLTGHDWSPTSGVRQRDVWPDYWVRTWGARGLLHVWDDVAAPSVLAGLDDEHWRPAEMCLKVSARHDVAGVGDGAAALTGHGLPRVRAQAMRALGAVGDTEHFAVVQAGLDDPDPDVRRHAARALDLMSARLDVLR